MSNSNAGWAEPKASWSCSKSRMQPGGQVYVEGAENSNVCVFCNYVLIFVWINSHPGVWWSRRSHMWRITMEYAVSISLFYKQAFQETCLIFSSSLKLLLLSSITPGLDGCRVLPRGPECLSHSWTQWRSLFFLSFFFSWFVCSAVFAFGDCYCWFGFSKYVEGFVEQWNPREHNDELPCNEFSTV